MTARPKAGGDDGKPDDPEAQKKLDDALDEALDESFPASDPPSMTEPPHTRDDKDAV